jgi:hypothetical protein
VDTGSSAFPSHATSPPLRGLGHDAEAGAGGGHRAQREQLRGAWRGGGRGHQCGAAAWGAAARGSSLFFLFLCVL